MKPMPNNGTLRLPLKTVGFHDAETTLEEPEDPEPSATAEDIATGVMSISPIETSSAADANEQPPTAVGTDPVDAPEDVESPTGDVNDNNDDEPKEFKSWQDYWDWLTGKVDDLWHKITSSEDENTSA